jgi:hypothetical protein
VRTRLANPALAAPHAGKTLTEDCIKELDEFKIDRATNVNKNIPLGTNYLVQSIACLPTPLAVGYYAGHVRFEDVRSKHLALHRSDGLQEGCARQVQGRGPQGQWRRSGVPAVRRDTITGLCGLPPAQ